MQFDYAGVPPEISVDSNGGSNYTIQFQVNEDGITTALDSYHANAQKEWVHEILWNKDILFDEIA